MQTRAAAKKAETEPETDAAAAHTMDADAPAIPNPAGVPVLPLDLADEEEYTHPSQVVARPMWPTILRTGLIFPPPDAPRWRWQSEQGTGPTLCMTDASLQAKRAVLNVWTDCEEVPALRWDDGRSPNFDACCIHFDMCAEHVWGRWWEKNKHQFADWQGNHRNKFCPSVALVRNNDILFGFLLQKWREDYGEPDVAAQFEAVWKNKTFTRAEINSRCCCAPGGLVAVAPLEQ